VEIFDSLDFARTLVDPNISRLDIVRLSSGMTPAKLAEVLSLLNAAELVIAMTILRI
jgi:propanediol dehydratase large subunit